MTVVGLVVEGTNDYPIISRFVESCLSERFERPIEFRHLQPLPDATMTGYSGGGWTRVVGWCKANAGSRIETFFVPLEEGEAACDLIIVHLDGDALEPCAKHFSKAIPPVGCPAADRVSTLAEMLTEWLQLPSNRSDQIRGAFPVLHSEAWLLAALLPDQAHWESELNCKSPFRALNVSSKRLASFYSEKSIEAAASCHEISRQSVSFSLFLNSLSL